MFQMRALQRQAYEAAYVCVEDKEGQCAPDVCLAAVRVRRGCGLRDGKESWSWIAQWCQDLTHCCRHASSAQVRPVLIINKIDRLILELRMSPEEAYGRWDKHAWPYCTTGYGARQHAHTHLRYGIPYYALPFLCDHSCRLGHTSRFLSLDAPPFPFFCYRLRDIVSRPT